jgi:hypothetical protein
MQLASVVQQVASRFQIFAVAFAAYDPAFDADGRIAQVPAKILDLLVGAPGPAH